MAKPEELNGEGGKTGGNCAAREVKQEELSGNSGQTRGTEQKNGQTRGNEWEERPNKKS